MRKTATRSQNQSKNNQIGTHTEKGTTKSPQSDTGEAPASKSNAPNPRMPCQCTHAVSALTRLLLQFPPHNLFVFSFQRLAAGLHFVWAPAIGQGGCDD